jgi:hypothetical protein
MIGYISLWLSDWLSDAKQTQETDHCRNVANSYYIYLHIPQVHFERFNCTCSISILWENVKTAMATEAQVPVTELNSGGFILQANYTDRETAACRRSYANFCG